MGVTFAVTSYFGDMKPERPTPTFRKKPSGAIEISNEPQNFQPQIFQFYKKCRDKDRAETM